MTRRRDGVVASLLAAAIFAVWWPSLGASFQFDDWNVIVGDPRVHSLGAWWDSMPGMRPVLKLSYALNYALGGSVEGFRGFNLLLHALNAGLVYRLLQRFGSPLAAGVAALLFALHPVQTEAVTYVSGRSVALAGGLALLSVLLGLRRADGPRPGLALAGSLLAFALALGAKETAAIVPVVLVLCRVALRAADESAGHALRAGFAAAVPHLLLLLAALAAAALLAPYRFTVAANLAERTILDNLVTQANGVSYLIGQLLFLDRLNADPMLAAVRATDPQALARGAMLATFVAAGFAGLRGGARWGFGVLWFFAWLAPTNSFMPRLDVANDRQLYVAIAGPAWLVGLALARLGAPGRGRATIAAALVAALVATLAAATVQRNRVYADEIAFWEDVVAKTPRNARGWNNLGMARAVACRTDEAVVAFGQAARLDPADPKAAINRALLRRGDLPGVPARCARPRGRRSGILPGPNGERAYG